MSQQIQQNVTDLLENLEFPVKPNMVDYQNVTMVLGEKDQIFIIHDQPFREKLGWAEYDKDKNNLVLMTRKGNMHDCGLHPKEEHIEQIKKADQVLVVWLKDRKIADIYFLPLTVNDTGLISH